MKNRYQPAFDSLCARVMPSSGVAVALNQGTLVIHRTNVSQNLNVDILTAPSRPLGHAGLRGFVVVEGVAKFRAARVKSITIDPGSTVAGVNIHQSASAPIAINLLEPTTIAPSPPQTTSAPATPATPTSQVLTSDETGSISALGQQIVDLTNAQRNAVGLPSLVVNNQLVLAAQIHAHDMAKLQYMEHTLSGVALSTLQDRANYVNYHYAWLGENIAEGFADANSVMTGWMNSPGHKANILQPNFTEIGVAISADANGVLYFSVEFGSQQG